ncbi:hypothetical protein [Paenibacillus sp. PAMC 26794]|uniref:hypothetical protein n=1 Tax=Paenibacillus sp. PAMC 26794 TaxID=1257080 RepID=UPI0002D89D46|nr:hypothetical protein [Paenibacillus sp. PAMC 26794]
MKKKWTVLSLLVIFLIYSFGVMSIKTYASFKNGYPDKDIEVKPSGLARGKQTIKVKVTGKANPRPKTIWTQGDFKIWQATSEKYGRVETNTYSSKLDALPLKLPSDKFVKDEINTKNYVPDSLQDKPTGNKFKRDHVTDIEIDDIKYNTIDETYSIKPGSKPAYKKGSLLVTIETRTGTDSVDPDDVADYQWEKKTPYGTRQDGDPKYQVEYYTPLEIDYSGYVTETKEIRVREDMQLQLNDVKSLVAEIRTKAYDQEEFGNWINVSKRADQIEWSSNKQNVVYVEPKTGQIVAKNIGTAVITAKWKNSEKAHITFMKM